MGFSLCSTESIAQTAVFTMSSIPRHALEQILDPELLASNTEKTAEWAATTTTEVRKLVAPLIAKSEFFYIEFQYVLIDQVRRFEARARETEMELKKKETEIAQQLLGRA
mmetsp:Transcript_29957/g.62878  ORF Transcript_29957/g.62878 Transcript_29957/m.62878 type:complete len:110 (+) Transcript_29957:528-857(+)